MAIKNLNTGNGIAKKLLQRLHITAVPRDLDRVADGTLYAARRRGKLLRDLRIEHLRHKAHLDYSYTKCEFLPQLHIVQSLRSM